MDTNTTTYVEQKDEATELMKQMAHGSRNIRVILGSNLSKEIKEQLVLKGSGTVLPYQPCPCGSGKKFKFCCYKGV